MPVLMATNAAQQLVEKAESTPGSIKMPKTLMLVKQLKKELNITKTMKEEHKRVGELVHTLAQIHVFAIILNYHPTPTPINVTIQLMEISIIVSEVLCNLHYC